MKASRDKALRAAAAIFLVALALRAAPAAWHRLDGARLATTDTGRYLALADRLAAGDGFCLPARPSWCAVGTRDRAPRLEPELFRTPGYPLILALAGSLPGSRAAWVLGMQIFAGALTAALCYALASAWASPRAGLLAAAFLAFDPAHVLYSNLLMSDVLCGASIAAALVLLEAARGSTGGGRWWLAAAGCLLSAATALRPVAVLLVVPATVYLWRRGRRGGACRGGACRGAWPGVAALAATALLFPLGWTARNGLTTGTWTLSTAFDVNLALVVAARIEARARDLPRSAAEARVMAHAVATEQATGQPFHRACRAVGIETLLVESSAAMAEVPLAVTEMLLAGERRYLMQVLGLAASEGRERRPAAAAWPDLRGYSCSELLLISGQALFMAAVWLLAAGGVLSLWRQDRADAALFALFALAVVLVPSLVVGTGRMRLPVVALVHGLAGIGAARCLGEDSNPGVEARSASS